MAGRGSVEAMSFDSRVGSLIVDSYTGMASLIVVAWFAGASSLADADLIAGVVLVESAGVASLAGTSSVANTASTVGVSLDLSAVVILLACAGPIVDVCFGVGVGSEAVGFSASMSLLAVGLFCGTESVGSIP